MVTNYVTHLVSKFLFTKFCNILITQKLLQLLSLSILTFLSIHLCFPVVSSSTLMVHCLMYLITSRSSIYCMCIKHQSLLPIYWFVCSSFINVPYQAFPFTQLIVSISISTYALISLLITLSTVYFFTVFQNTRFSILNYFQLHAINLYM